MIWHAEVVSEGKWKNAGITTGDVVAEKRRGGN
jgi:hypothetical protein